MKFSVVITTYNRVSLLRRAVESALGQTIPCEVVVADDCSSDDTAAYVASLGDVIVYHRNEVNQGHAATVNAGVQKASGDWIKFLDDDDYLAANCIEEMAKAIALCPSAVICSCIAAQVDENEVELSRTPKLGPGSAFYVPQTDIHYGMLLELLPFGTPVQVACRRDTFCQTGGWDSKLDANCDDIDSWLRIAQFGDAVFINQCLAYRTIWAGAYNHKFAVAKRLNTNILIKEKIYALVNEKYHQHIPNLQDIKSYLKLHWAFVALKQKNLQNFFLILDKGAFSPAVWRLLLNAIFLRRSGYDNHQIRKFVLIES
ncbi:glycosyltransferase family 2 protein [Nostoc sp. FACHB-152]|uniref:glycosyltransferase family 2 protein n=1 Tax=unclassified Nostoc TaxID=2593658 RepID=UPI00168937F8|nr:MULTISPECIES: glycosyltransferase family 2 protein [unclassified Nostoc]MBD2446712.1 glycosyltransferase family 2 protein [Nostoc sp. FACHB-152]MBD2466560.1 glycosyltransferase family 2 protein [Nostoc sp. FACHB-145]